jgi:hypothetical protein
MVTRSEGLGKLTSNRNYDNLSGTSMHGGSSALNGTGTIIIQGTLTKKGRGSIYFPWSSRFVTLDDNGYLRYYKHAHQNFSFQSTVSEQETNLRGIVNLRGCTVRVLSSKERHKHPFAFILENLPSQYATQSSTLTLAANSASEMHGWVSLIQTLAAKLADQADENSKYRYETLDTLLGKSGLVSSSSISGPTVMHTSSTIAEFRQLKEIRRQQQRQRDAALSGDRELDATAAALAIACENACQHTNSALRIDDKRESWEED